jgi:hypothetical protein
MLEASIRKIVVTVHWKEGVRDRSLVVTQFVTDPRQGELDPDAAEGLADGGVLGGLGGLLGGGTGTGTGSSSGSDRKGEK